MPNQTRDHANKEEHATFLKAAKSSLFLESEKKYLNDYFTCFNIKDTRWSTRLTIISTLNLKKNDLLSNHNKLLLSKE